MSLLETKKRGRPKKDSVMDTLALRVPEELVTEIDEYIALLQRELPGLDITRASAIRNLLTVGLKAEQKRMHGRS
jgi:hypothetical protein